MNTEPRTCSVILRDASLCDDVHYGLGLCAFHYTRHKAGWSDDELSLPPGADRFSRPCPVVWHDTGAECGDPTHADLCHLHAERRRRGWSDEELGRPKRVRYAIDAKCSVIEHDTGIACPRALDSKGMCILHYGRHCQGWSDDELGLPKGASRKAPETCWVIEHATDTKCGEPLKAKGLCTLHYGRHRQGWSDDELVLPKGAIRVEAMRCSVIEHHTGAPCPRSFKAHGMCTFHYQRHREGWPAERLGEPQRCRARAAMSTDLAALRSERERFCAHSATGDGYVAPLRAWRKWLEQLAMKDPAALAQPEDVLVASFVSDRAAERLSASSLDVNTAAISWWARFDGRPDPTLGTRDMRRAHRRLNPAPRPVAGELTLVGVRSLFEAMPLARWAHHRRDPENADRFAKAILMTLFHLAARRSDVARLRMSDIERTDEGWRIVPWVRKNWPGGTPDGLWLVPTKDPLFDPVQAMDDWMEFRAPLGEGFVFCAFDGEWHPGTRFAYQQLDVFMRHLGTAAGLGPLSSGVFRRTMTQLLTDQGVDEAELLRLLGQRDVKTLRRYQTKKKAPSAAEQLLRLYRHADGEHEEADDES